MHEKILFVDDEPHLLDAIKRQLYKNFEIDTAHSGHEALKLIKQSGPYAVVVSDMRMPGMDGITLLKAIEKLSPDSIRIMLTGNIDQQTAINAVNEGHVFRFINKPCERVLLIKSLEASIEQYRLIHAEKVLLNGTLKGTIKLLTDLLSLSESPLLNSTINTEKLAVKVAESLQVKILWQMHFAALLSHIGHMTLPFETTIKLDSGEEITEQEKKIIHHLPEVSYKLLNNIPRLKNVAKFILYQEKNFDGTGFPEDRVLGCNIPLESRILKVVNDLKAIQIEKKIEAKEVLQIMQKNNRYYDQRVLESVSWFIEHGYKDEEVSDIKQLYFNELEAGQILVSNIVSISGRLLLTSGHTLTEASLQRLNNINQIEKIKEPIRISLT